MDKALRDWLMVGAVLLGLFTVVVMDGAFGKGVLLETLRELLKCSPWR
jgi:hypothetical protein